MNQIYSRIFSWIRLPLAVLVVAIHTPFCDDNSGFAYYIGTFLSRTIADVAVPTFFFIAGFLFFVNRQHYDFEDYKMVLNKKAKSLLIPYLLWNTIAYVMVVIGNYFYFHRGFGKVMPWELFRIFWAQDMGYVVNSAFGYKFSLLSAPIDGPLWFIRDLMIAMLLTPIIYFIIKKLKYWSAIVFILPYYLYLGIPIRGFGLVALCFFPLGAYFSLMGINPMSTNIKIGGGKIAIIVISIILICFSYYAYVFDLDIRIIHQLKRMVCVPLFLIIARKLSVKNIGSRIIKVGETSFWIYVVHTLPIMYPLLLPFSFLQPIPFAGETLYYLISIIMKALICISTYYLFKRICPNVLKFAVGGR